jgi:hypothetical protein
MIRRVVFRPATVRDLARLDHVVQARIDAALVRLPRQATAMCLEPPDFIRVLGIDNRGEAY